MSMSPHAPNREKFTCALVVFMVAERDTAQQRKSVSLFHDTYNCRSGCTQNQGSLSELIGTRKEPSKPTSAHRAAAALKSRPASSTPTHVPALCRTSISTVRTRCTFEQGAAATGRRPIRAKKRQQSYLVFDVSSLFKRELLPVRRARKERSSHCPP